MTGLQDVDTGSFRPNRFKGLVSREQYQAFSEVAEQARAVFGERTIWNVNSTAFGGGVAEMLRSLVAYARGAGLDARWLVIPGSPEFFRVTKRIHNHLQNAPGDGGTLDEDARHVYEETLAGSAQELAARVRPGDVLLLHDPQTAGLVPAMARTGAHVIWRCHVGIDTANHLARGAWSFLLPYVLPADSYVFSRADFAWHGLDLRKLSVIPPSIDAFSPKNREMDAAQVTALLTAAHVLSGDDRHATFVRQNGSEAVLTHPAHMLERERLSPVTRVVTQVSRWDRLKDPVGVIRGFAEHVAPCTDAHLLVAGPDVIAVADDPEGGQVLQESIAAWEELPTAVSRQVHLAILPMVDNEENAALVNAIQRHSEIVVQKSLAEGFGLTVAEAMWKGRPVVASRIGGIRDQIDEGRTGLTLRDPRDLAEYGAAVRSLLNDRERAARMGAAGQEKVRDHFLGPRHLIQYARLMMRLAADRPEARPSR